MKLHYHELHTDLSSQKLIQRLAEASENKASLISGAHQMLLPNGLMNTFGEFARLTGALAAELSEALPSSELFMQVNDQLDFEGLVEGKIPSEGRRFWEQPWEYLQEEGYDPQWDPSRQLKGGLDIHGQAVPGLVSEWRLQRWHQEAGLRSAHWPNAKSTKKVVLKTVYRNVPPSALEGTSCRASGCAHEIMVEAPFCVQKGYRQLIGFWPNACKGPVLFGSTLAAMAMERGLKTRLSDLNFEGPFRYLHLFLNTANPKNFTELIEGAALVSVSAEKFKDPSS